MRYSRFIAVVVLLFAAAPRPAASWPAASLQHLLKDEDCEAVPGLLGDWNAHGNLEGTWALQKLGERNYRLLEQVAEPNSENRPAFDICVAHLGGHLFFDATYAELHPDGKEVFAGDAQSFWIAAHFIGRLDVEKNAVHFRLLDDDWLQDALKSGRVHLTVTHWNDGEEYLLVGPSKELKEFAMRFAKDLKAFSYEQNLERVPQRPAEGRFCRPHHGELLPQLLGFEMLAAWAPLDRQDLAAPQILRFCTSSAG